MDVFVTLPDEDLTTATPINPAPFAYQTATERLEVAAGTYQIRITPAGDPTNVVFDSGELALAADADLLIAALANTGPGVAPVQLTLMDGSGSSVLFDVNTPAAVTAVHASPDAGSVDVVADDAATEATEAIALASSVDFAAVCTITAVPAPGSYNVNITEAGNVANVALSIPLDATQAAEITAIVTGYAMSAPELQAIALGTDTRRIATETKLRVIHAAGSTAEVDIYLLPDGTEFADEATEPAFAAVPFSADTGILSVAPAVYDVYVTPTGSKSVIAIEVQDLTVEGGQVLDVIARDPAEDGSEGTLPQLIVIDYGTVVPCTI